MAVISNSYITGLGLIFELAVSVVLYLASVGIQAVSAGFTSARPLISLHNL